ncbi:MAG TPA: PEP-CTERM sorting domain-containing protein [Candidatus Omnitrophota bacterium]|nr:PEP-CTERM sorting domain-containing protein [Candidatus Omnitrophota bacterium]
MKKIILSVLMVSFFFLGASQVFAANVDLWADFPDNQGDNGLYAYGWSESAGYRLLTDTDAYCFFSPGRNWSIPYVFKNTDSVRMHPSGWNNSYEEYAVLGYNVQSNGIYDITGQFLMYGSGNIYVDILKNGDVIWKGTSLSLNYTGDFDIQDIALNNGDFIYFRVSPNGNDYDDWGGLTGTITSVTPEPVSSALFLIGGTVMGIARSRRRIK